MLPAELTQEGRVPAHGAHRLAAIGNRRFVDEMSEVTMSGATPFRGAP